MSLFVDALFGHPRPAWVNIGLLVCVHGPAKSTFVVTGYIIVLGLASPQLVLLSLLLVHPLTSILVEVRLSPTSTSRFDTIRNAVHQYIWKSFETIALPLKLDGWEDVPVLTSSVEQIMACKSSSPASYLPVAQASLQIYVYQPTDGNAVEGFSTGSSGDGEEIMVASVCKLYHTCPTPYDSHNLLRWAGSDQINCTWIAGALGPIAMEQLV